MRIAVDILIGLSAFFALAGVIGLLRMPDAYCRMQSSTNIGTFGVLGVIIGGALYAGYFLGNGSMVLKLLILGGFYIVTTPISSHAIAKGAYRHGVKMSDKAVCDHYGEDLES